MTEMSTYSLRRPAPRAVDPAAPLNHDPALIDADTLPPGYRRHVLKARIGTGGEWYRRARAALLARVMFEMSWVTAHGAAPPFQPGQGLVVVSRVWPLWASSPVRVLSVEESDLRTAVTIGAVEGHQIRGVERFSVTLNLETGAVLFEINAVSQPIGFAKLARPISRLVQRRFRTAAADIMAAESRPPRTGTR
jgi:uncharacterized protein (UPF0548 family)